MIPVSEPPVVTDATALLLLLQVPPEVASVSNVLLPAHKLAAPEIGMIPGSGCTVTNCVAAPLQPPALVIVKLIVAVPALRPVTWPALFTLATPELVLLHTPPVLVSDNDIEEPTHTPESPVLFLTAAGSTLR